MDQLKGGTADEGEANQAEMQERASRLASLVDASDDAIIAKTPEGVITDWNRAAESPAEMEGWGWQSVHDSGALPAALARWKESIATGQPFDMEFPLRGADGEFRPFLTRVMPLRDAADRVVQWFGTNTDITERKLAEAERERLLEKEQEFSEELAALNEKLQAQNQELRVAQAETARLLEEQSSLFRRLQEALLDIPQELPGVKFGHLYRSATHQAKVGGDFYDVFAAKQGEVALLIGDVSGHGVEAARIASLVKDTVHAFAHQFATPHLVLRETNRLLVEKKMPGFVTTFLGLLDPDTGRFIYSSAGHPAPLLALDGHIAPLESINPPLGVFADSRYRDEEVQIKEGSLLLLYTDGITEARNGDAFFGEGGLMACLERLSGQPVETLPSLLLEEALLFSGGLLRDDAALLAVSYLGKTGGREQT